MIAPLICAGEPAEAIASALRGQMERDLAETVVDNDDLTTLVKAFAVGVDAAARTV